MMRRPGPGPYFEVHHGGGHPWFGVLLLLLLAAGVALLALTLWRSSRLVGVTGAAASTPSGTTRDPALAELRLRYARGEIDRDEYLQRATDLGDVVPLPHQQATGDT